MTAGVLGGTFDPVHNGHICMARHLISEMNLDEIIFLPSYISPHKQGLDISSAEDRLEMLRLAISGEPGFSIEEYEIHNEGVSYSIKTIRHLKKKREGQQFYWIVGADMLMYIEKWHKWRNVLAETGFIAVNRQGCASEALAAYSRKLAEDNGADIRISNMEPVNISSTDIRKRSAEGRDISELVPAAVGKYIAEKGLYKARRINGND